MRKNREGNMKKKRRRRKERRRRKRRILLKSGPIAKKIKKNI
jgi:hypothetical protein